MGDSEWDNVIITVPASFQNAQRNDVINAVHYAKIKEYNGMLFDEPTSAFLGYFNQLELEEKKAFLKKDEQKLLVIDFGGGTIDLSTIIIQKESGLSIGIDNIAISRYNDLGGQDLDMIIAEKYLLPQITKSLNVEFDNEEITNELLPQLAVMAEKLKKDICNTVGAMYPDFSSIKVDSSILSQLTSQNIAVGGKTYTINQVTLTAEEFDNVTSFVFQKEEYELSMVDKVIRSVPTVVNDVISKSNWIIPDIDYVLLAGGSVKNPLFVKRVQMLLPKSSVLLPQAPDTIVAKGAAINSFYKYGMGVQLFHPICSDTIGVTTANADFFPLIKAGQSLPFKVKLPTFTLQNDFQSNIEIPCCLNNKSNVMAILKTSVNSNITSQDELTIEMEMTSDKVLNVAIEKDNIKIGEMTVGDPVMQCNMTDDERRIFQMEKELETAKSSGSRNKERQTLRGLIWEYYDLGNYKRSIQAGEKYLECFDNSDVYVMNIIYCAYNELGQRQKAESYLDKALEYSPNNSTLVYNKSLIIENKKGKRESLKFLNDHNESDSVDIKFRKAILNDDLGNKEPVEEIKKEYDLGMINPTSIFESKLLKDVLNRADSNNSYAVISNQEKEHKVMSVDSTSLLKVKGSISTI